LNGLVQQNEIVRFDQGRAFFVITHPELAQHKSENSLSLGWRLHISVHPDDLKQAFNLAAPIISQYCSCFKVTNPEEITSERFTQGAQITIPLEVQKKWDVTPENAEKMMKEIHQAFVTQGIRTGQKPGSDAATVSDYFSMRNDKVVLLSLGEVHYLPAKMIGKNFNPTNNPNPFSHLLSAEVQSFDPLAHFQSFECELADWDVSREPLFNFTMTSYVREHTIFDSMSKKERDEFILQFCLENGEKLDAQFLKEPYRDNPEILSAVKCALSIIVIEEGDRSWTSSAFHHHVTQSAFSTRYPLDNSFQKFLVILEDYSKEKMREINDPSKLSLMDQGKVIAKKALKNLTEEELIPFIQTGHPYQAKAALEKLEQNSEHEKYIQILHDNDTVPAVQHTLAKVYKGYQFDDPEKSETYYLKAMLSTASNCLEPDFEILLKHQSFDQLLELHKGGIHAASLLLAGIYMRDVLSNKSNNRLSFEKFAGAPIDHVLAKECVSKVQSNPLYEREVRDLIGLLK